MATLKEKLADPDRLLTIHIATIPSPAVTQAIVAAGADGIIIDFEHGAFDYASAHAVIAATARSGCAPLVRVAENEDWQVKRVLDLGAEGICFPLVRTAEDVRRAVASLRYPPRGTRGFGPFLSHSHEGTTVMEYRAAVDDTRICMILIETIEAVENIEEICAVEGIDIIIPAMFDLSTAYGVSGQFDHPHVTEALARIEEVAMGRGIPLGVTVFSKAQADKFLARGYRILAGVDVFWVRNAAAEMADWAR